MQMLYFIKNVKTHIFGSWDNITEYKKILPQARSLGFECEEGVCKCNGAHDCFRMGRSRHCGIILFYIGATCWCNLLVQLDSGIINAYNNLINY